MMDSSSPVGKGVSAVTAKTRKKRDFVVAVRLLMWKNEFCS
jgi:hypothetical protein